MTVLVEIRHPAEFILSEASGQRSRDTITIALGAGIIAAGTGWAASQPATAAASSGLSCRLTCAMQSVSAARRCPPGCCGTGTSLATA